MYRRLNGIAIELKNSRKPIVAMMGLAFKPNIDDLRESPSGTIVKNLVQMCGDANLLIVEPNINEHKTYELTDYKVAYEKADIVVMLTAHNQFKTLPWDESKIILDFCGIYKR